MKRETKSLKERPNIETDQVIKRATKYLNNDIVAKTVTMSLFYVTLLATMSLFIIYVPLFESIVPIIGIKSLFFNIH